MEKNLDPVHFLGIATKIWALPTAADAYLTTASTTSTAALPSLTGPSTKAPAAAAAAAAAAEAGATLSFLRASPRPWRKRRRWTSSSRTYSPTCGGRRWSGPSGRRGRATTNFNFSLLHVHIQIEVLHDNQSLYLYSYGSRVIYQHMLFPPINTCPIRVWYYGTRKGLWLIN